MTAPHSRALIFAAALTASAAQAVAQDLQSAGQVAIHSAPGVVSTSSANYLDVPGLKGAVTLPAGGDLTVTVSITGNVRSAADTMYVRVLVDDLSAEPSSMRFFSTAANARSTTCNFFYGGLRPGQHLVRVQAKVTGGAADLAARSMILRFAAPDSPYHRLGWAHNPFASRPAGGYADVPGVATTVDVPYDSRLLVLTAGDFNCVGTRRVFVRAVVDGTPTKDAISTQGPTLGCGSFSFVTGKLPRGRHSVRLQWLTEDTATVSGANLTVVAINDAVNYKTGWLQQSPASGPSIRNSSATFAPMPGADGGNAWVPSRCDLAIRFCGEVSATAGSRLVLRLLVDGKVAPHGQGELLAGGGAQLFAAREKLFVVRNLERGWHNVRLEWAVSGGGTAYLGDRTLAATAVIGQRPLLVTATESKRPAGYRYGGLFTSSVVDVVGGKRVFKPYVADNFFRARPGIADWFAENARGHMYVVEAAVVGPNLKLFDEQTYRSLPNAFTAMKLEALTYADAVFDYSFYDRDGDGIVRTDELYALVVMYQDTTFGEVRSLPTLTTRDGVTVDYSAGIATVYTPDFKSRGQLGVIDHELAHLLLGAGDMYETSWDPTAPGPYSIMDQHSPNGHLDPLHKLVRGRWYEAYGQTTDRWLTLTPVAEGGSILKLYDPGSHPGEYFLVENRAWRGYNAGLPAAGLAVWHCDESRLPDWRTAVEIEPACGPTNPLRFGEYLFGGDRFGFDPSKDLWGYSGTTNTRWHDGQLSQIGLWGIERIDDGSGSIRVFVDVPAPGVLVQFEDHDVSLGGTGTATMNIRVINTGRYPDTFSLAVSVQGTPSWSNQTVTLLSYERRDFALVVRPGSAATVPVSVTATGNGVKTTDEALIRHTLRQSGSPLIGTTVTLVADHPEHAGEGFIMVAALGNTPGMYLPGGLFLPINNDTLFQSCLTAPSIFDRFVGTLDSRGQGHSFVHLPNLPAIRGLRLYFAYVTVDSGAFTATSNGVDFTIR